MIWSILWFLHVYESPGEHETISSEEKNHIESTLNFVNKKIFFYNFIKIKF